MKKLIFVMLLGMVMSMPALANGDDIKVIMSQAQVGNAQAQNSLGVMYDNGKGVHQDYSQAKYWYELAAKQGFAEAQYNLGVMYAKGKGVPQNTHTAKEWFGKACDNGFQMGCDKYKLLNQLGYW